MKIRKIELNVYPALSWHLNCHSDVLRRFLSKQNLTFLIREHNQISLSNENALVGCSVLSAARDLLFSIRATTLVGRQYEARTFV